MNRLRIAFGVVFATSVLSSSLLAPGPAGDMLVVFSYLLFVGTVLYRTPTLVGPRFALVAFAFVAVIAVINMARFPVATTHGASQILRTPLFVGVVGLNLFLLPRVLSEMDLAVTVNRIVAVVVLVGIPSVFFGAHGFLWIRIEPYVPFQSLFVTGPSLDALVSIYPDTNAASKIAMFGTFFSLFEYRQKRSVVSLVLLAIAATGVYLTYSRGVFVAMASAAGLYVVYRLLDEQLMDIVLLIFLVSWGVLFALLIGFLPWPSVMPSVQLSSRKEAWEASIRAVRSHPLLGMGFGESAAQIEPYFSESGIQSLSSQNSYLRLFVSTGVVGGFAYCYLVIRSLFTGVQKLIEERVPVEFLLLAVAIAVLQLFENFSLFGVNQSSLLASLVFGYLLTPGDESRYSL